MSDLQVAYAYPDAIAERRKWLLAQIDATYDRLQEDLKRRYLNAVPPDYEVRAAEVRCLELTRQFHDELTLIEQRTLRHVMVAQ